MVTRNFKPQELLARGLPYDAIEDQIIAHSRWSVRHTIVFECEGKFYRADYSVGATESQDESPWQYDDVVTCVEVKNVPRTVEVWEPVND